MRAMQDCGIRRLASHLLTEGVLRATAAKILAFHVMNEREGRRGKDWE